MSTYPLLKALHLCAAVAWLTTFSSLARLLAPHILKSAGDLAGREPWLEVVRECSFRSAVFAVLAIISGLALWGESVISGGWLHAKLLLVGLMIVLQFGSARILGQLRNNRPSSGFRWFGMVLPLGLGAIVLAVLRPF